MYIGLDLSLSETGAIVVDTIGTRLHTGLIKSNKRGVHRLQELKGKVERVLDNHKLRFAAVEGYAMGKGGGRGQNAGRVFDIGEWGGIVRLLLLERGLPTIIVPPSNLKMFVALNGAAKKPQVVAAVASRFGYETKNDNLADAYGLAIMAAAFDTGNTPTDHKKESEALSKVKQIIWAPAVRVRQRSRTA